MTTAPLLLLLLSIPSNQPPVPVTPILVTPIPVQAEDPVAAAPIYDDEFYLQANDGACSLLVREYGDGPPVVVLHGGWGAEHSYLLDAIWPHRGDHRFVLYDQRGSLRSPAAAQTITLQRHVADLEELREELGLERMTLLAHSMGTFLALAYAEAHPERVERLVLVAAVPPVFDAGSSPNDAWSENAKYLMERPEVEEILASEGLTGSKLSDRQQTHAWRIRFASVNLAHPERWRQLRGGRIFYSQEAANAVLPSVPQSWDFTMLFDSFPIHVLIGNEDYVDPGAGTWLETDPGDAQLEIEVLERAGHAAWIDNPEAFRVAIARALAP